MNDFDTAYSAMLRHADSVVLDPPSQVRRRADRRGRLRMVPGALAVAAAVGAGTAGVQWALGSNGPPPDPATSLPPTQSRSHTPPPTSNPPTAPPTAPPTKPSIVESTPPPTGPTEAIDPTAIPTSAFLHREDRNGNGELTASTGEFALPDLCGANLPGKSLQRSTRSIDYRFWRTSDASDYINDGVFTETITVYRGDGGKVFMSGLRAAVAACPSEMVNSDRHTYRLLQGTAFGDDSILIEERQPERGDRGDLSGGTTTHFLSAVRVGNAVLVLRELAWEHAYFTDRTTYSALTAKAASRLTAWLR